MSVAVEYELAEGDWLAFQRVSEAVHADASRLLSGATWFGFAGSAAVDLVGMLFLYRVQFPIVLAFFTAYFVLAYVLRDVVNRRQVRRAIDRHATLARRLRVDLDETGIRQRSDRYETAIRWSAVDRVGETESHLVITVGGFPTILIPKRAFAADRELRDFAHFARESQAGARAPLE